MNKLWSCECTNCGNIWDELLGPKEVCGLCPKCNSAFTDKLPGGLKNYKAKAPYDYLDKGPPDGKKIFSGPKVHSK
jgi:rubredoxin